MKINPGSQHSYSLLFPEHLLVELIKMATLEQKMEEVKINEKKPKKQKIKKEKGGEKGGHPVEVISFKLL